MSRIYCIEDDKSICNLVEYTLEKSDFEACGFNDGASFFDEINQKEAKLPDLILLDIMLPGEDGYEILKKLRADSRTENIPVIMLTAKGSEYDKVLALDQGADDYVTKPFGMMELISGLRLFSAAMVRLRKKRSRMPIPAGIFCWMMPDMRSLSRRRRSF